jgi:dATP pyrophosphohydrolase
MMSDPDACVAIAVYVLRRLAGETELLFLRRSGGRFEGQWWPVTGTREPQEDPVQCAMRELHEETGLIPTALYQTDRTAPVEGGGYLRIFVAPIDASMAVQINWEHDAHRWCSIAQAQAIVGDVAEPILHEAVRVFEAEPPQQRVIPRGRT